MKNSEKSVNPVKSEKLYQQGDVLIFTTNEIPQDCKEVKPNKSGNLTLAEGEVTGHSHTLDKECGTLFRDNLNQLWLETNKTTTIKHQEHKPVTIPKGKYKIGIVQEIDPFLEEIQSVRD